MRVVVSATLKIEFYFNLFRILWYIIVHILFLKNPHHSTYKLALFPLLTHFKEKYEYYKFKAVSDLQVTKISKISKNKNAENNVYLFILM